MLCMLPLPLLESMALRRGAEGKWGIGFARVLPGKSPTLEDTGRKLVRVVVLDFGPWFAAQLCFLPAGVNRGRKVP